MGSRASTGLQYEDLGSGSAVVLLHGFAGTARTHFGPLIDALVQRYRVVAPDLRGYGKSQHLPRVQDAEMYRRDAQDVMAVLDDLGIEFVHLIGFSDGGESSIILAAQLGARARSATLWGVSGCVPPPHVIYLYEEPEERISQWPTLRDQLERLHGRSAEELLKSWAKVMTELQNQGGRIIDQEASKIVCPVLILAGDRDPFNPLEATQALVSRMPTARLVVFPQAGHDLLEDRGPQVLALVQRMLASSNP